MSTETKPKKTTTYVAAAVLIIIILAGVGYYFFQSSTVTPAQTMTTAMATTSASQYKDTIVMGTTDAVQTTIDPADAYDYFGINMIDNLGAPLVDFAPGTNNTSPSGLQPALATNWSVSSDGLTYTFILRSGLKYDDGTPFNSTDVKFSVERGMALNDPNGAFSGLDVPAIIDSVTTPNATAVVFHLKAPFSGFLSMLTFSIMYPVNPNKVPQVTCSVANSCNDMTGIVNFTSTSAAASNPNGLGPYTLTTWTRSGTKDTEMVLTANPNYWNYPTYPKTQTIIIKFYPDATSLAAAIRSGDVDFAYRQFTTTDIRSLMTTPGLKVYSSPGAFIQYLVINQNKAPFNDINVRQAIAAAINRTDLIDTVFAGTATPLYSQIPLGMAYHTDSFETAYGVGPNYNLTRELLAKSGYDANNKLPVDLWYETTGHYPQSPDQALVLKKDLEASGVITVTLNGVDWPTMHSNVRAGSMGTFIYGWYPDFIDPYDYTTPFLSSTGASWLNDGYNSTTMDSLLTQSLSATPSQAASIYTQIQTLQAHDVPMIPLYQGGSNCCGAVAKTSVGGIYLDVTLIFRLSTIYETTETT
ncbi:MAG TPA: ABC transporter substrate-binding protein [Candidatus Acidoferrales bacterium]|nr:ABC transporter substrate-binding protein [Candidatus Acidoferrales bacterium]